MSHVLQNPFASSSPPPPRQPLTLTFRALANRPLTHSSREWIKHSALFLLTIITTTFAGLMTSIDTLSPVVPDPVSVFDYALYPIRFYLQAINDVIVQAIAHPSLLQQGIKFSVSILSILTAHEAGHYLACRRYGIAATLPYFIPAPPLFLAGTFGAFIKIKSPIESRRALFDVAVAGPLAGFAVILPVAVAALLTATPAPSLPLESGEAIVLNDPLLLRLLASVLGVELMNIALNPFYLAAWIGLLVTSLNLLPVGQLDGGHTTYAIFGRRLHRLLGYAAFAVMLVLAVLGWQWHNTPGGFLYAVLLLVILRLRHPRAADETQPLGTARIVLAVATLVVFLLSFVPFPISIL